jgi:hypothetical protein
MALKSTLLHTNKFIDILITYARNVSPFTQRSNHLGQLGLVVFGSLDKARECLVLGIGSKGRRKLELYIVRGAVAAGRSGELRRHQIIVR